MGIGAIVAGIAGLASAGSAVASGEQQRKAARQQQIQLEDVELQEQRRAEAENERVRRQIASRQRGFQSLIATSPSGADQGDFSVSRNRLLGS